MTDDTTPMSIADYLRQNLSQAFGLSAECVDWLLDLWNVTQTLDDVADGDPVSREALDKTIWSALVAMPGNPWFTQNRGVVLPVLMTAIMKWHGSDNAERSGTADERSFVWRSAYYDLVMLAVLVTHGPNAAAKAAHHVMQLYGESFADYRSEFKGADNG